MTGVFLPGSTIGVLGAGQLGRMFAMAAQRLGYYVHTFAPEPETPAGQIADLAHRASYDDVDAVRAFAGGVDVVTFEFENVPAAAAQAAAERAVVRPGIQALEIAQHRGREKTFLAGQGLPVAPFAIARTFTELVDGLGRIGTPAVAKTTALGYDGKGQVLVARDADPAGVWQALGGRETILETFIELEREVSVIGARSPDGATALFGPIDNVHRDHILDVSSVPADLRPALAQQAIEATRVVLGALDYVGILCVEFFVAKDGRLYVNELAPRPHNSGHLTIDACRTSQFEQHLRAICGLPLGSFDLLQPAAMANLLGDLWSGGEPRWIDAFRVPGVNLHLYGKREARPGRKMGHLTALASTRAEATALVLDARAQLMRGR